MEVEDNHNFAVNGGLVVHNCADALRYYVMTAVRTGGIQVMKYGN